MQTVLHSPGACSTALFCTHAYAALEATPSGDASSRRTPHNAHAVQAAVLVQQEGALGTAGCVVGALAGAAMLSVMIQRVQVRSRCVQVLHSSKGWVC